MPVSGSVIEHDDANCSQLQEVHCISRLAMGRLVRIKGGRRMAEEGRIPATVAIAGLGAIGLDLAHALDAGVDGLRLIAVAARDPGAARARVAGFSAPPEVVGLTGLAAADIVVEAAP